MQSRRVILDGRKAVERYHALVEAGCPLFAYTHMLITAQALLYISELYSSLVAEQTQAPVGWFGKY